MPEAKDITPASGDTDTTDVLDEDDADTKGETAGTTVVETEVEARGPEKTAETTDDSAAVVEQTAKKADSTERTGGDDHVMDAAPLSNGSGSKSDKTVTADATPATGVSTVREEPPVIEAEAVPDTKASDVAVSSTKTDRGQRTARTAADSNLAKSGKRAAKGRSGKKGVRSNTAQPAETPQAARAKSAKNKDHNIFVSPRAPDDPGTENVESEPTRTPVNPYRVP